MGSFGWLGFLLGYFLLSSIRIHCTRLDMIKTALGLIGLIGGMLGAGMLRDSILIADAIRAYGWGAVLGSLCYAVVALALTIIYAATSRTSPSAGYAESPWALGAEVLARALLGKHLGPISPSDPPVVRSRKDAANAG